MLLDTKTSCEVALTHLKNKQFITAHMLFLDQDESLKKSKFLKSALLYMLLRQMSVKLDKEKFLKMKLEKQVIYF